jgi:capsular exopolysaccharide synthesis family protein
MRIIEVRRLSSQPNERRESLKRSDSRLQAPPSAHNTNGRPGQGEISLLEVWRLVLKRRSTLFLCLGIFAALAMLVSLILPTRYEAVGRLTLDFESHALQDAVARMSGAGEIDDLKLQTQVGVLETDSLSWEVIKRLRLDQRVEAAHRILGVGPMLCLSSQNQSFESITTECRDVLIREFHRRLKVEALVRTQIIEIRYRCKSRELAAQVVNTMADVYTETSFAAKYAAGLRASKWVSGQLEDAKNNAELAEEKFIDYERQTGTVGVDENHNVLIERLNAINQQLVIAETARIVREARYRVSLEGDPEALVEITQGSPLQVLHAEHVALASQYAQLDEKFGEEYPRVQQLKAQLDKSTSDLNAEIARSRDKINSEYETALKSETLLRNEFEQQKQKAYDTSEASIQAALLKRDVEASRDLYDQLVRQLHEAGILAGLRSTNVTIIDPARIPVRKAEPHFGLNLAFGLLAGGLLGVALCVLKENTDSRIYSPQDLAKVSTLPAIGMVPHLKNEEAPRRTVPSDGAAKTVELDRPDGIGDDAYRSLRTALLFSNARNPSKVLLVTSPLPREGKTTTSINLAAVFARKDHRVLLVDGDLRTGGLSNLLGLSSRTGGLIAALAGEDPARFYVPCSDVPNLSILPAGERPPKPPDLLDSDRMRELISAWREEFDHVIIDASHINGFSDAVILATMADTTALVLRAGQSRRQELLQTLETLKSVNANVSGAILNDIGLDSSNQAGYSSKIFGSYFNEKGTETRHG